MRVQRLDHVTITVSDVARSVRFYRDVLGLGPGPEWPDDVTMLACGDTYVAIAHWSVGKETSPLPAIAIDHFAFRVDAESFEQAKRVLRENGFPIDHLSDHGICQSLYVKDPDGHTVELACYELRGAPEKMPKLPPEGATPG